MAITQNPIIGTARKTAGGMVFSRSLDQNIIRAKPITYADRKSDAQMKQRNRMAAVNGLTKADSKKALDALYPTRPNKQTKYSRFVQQLILVVTGLVAGFTLNFSVLPSMGNGTLQNFSSGISFMKDSSALQVLFSNGAPSGSDREDDLAFVIIFNETLNSGYSEITPARLADESATIVYPAGWLQAHTYQVYVGFTSAELYNSTLAVKASVL